MAKHQGKPEELEAVLILDAPTPATADQVFAEMPAWLQEAIDREWVTWAGSPVIVTLHPQLPTAMRGGPGEYITKDWDERYRMMTAAELGKKYRVPGPPTAEAQPAETP